jgi:hypothetical protein
LGSLVQRRGCLVLVLDPEVQLGDCKDNFAEQAVKGGEDILVKAERRQFFLDGDINLQIGPVLFASRVSLLLITAD